jgi:hypothetical protein
MIYVILGLTAVCVFLYLKNRGSKALLENLETKEELNKIDTVISKNQGTLEAEEIKREELKKDLQNAKASSTTDVDFINKRYGSGSDNPK